ncbi:MAG: DUF2892 domain-containing protein [Thermaceae bacterium]|nr:DUF2892 domain-containing protein [Thermaceae bacterium]
MIANVGSTDKIVRFVLALVFFIIALMVGAALWKWVFAILGVVMVVTALLNFCPIWAAFGISTRGKTAS